MDIEPIRLTLDRPEDLLAYLPYRFGYVPTESLVTLAVLEPAPGSFALGLAARLDLADLMVPGVLSAAAAGIRSQLEQDPTSAALTVLYTDAPLAHVRDGRGAVGGVLARWLELIPCADRARTYVVSPTAFACLKCEGCCPPDGRSLERLSETAIAARMVLAGESLVGSREELGCSRGVAPERLATATAAADRERRGMRARSATQKQRWRRRLLDLFGTALAEAAARPGTWAGDATVLGRLGAAMSDPLLRDALVTWTVSGERVAPGAPEVLDSFRDMVTGGLELPHPDHLQAARLVLSQIARHAARGRAGYALAMLGWLAWWCGEGARADVLMRQCLEDDPDCSLGGLLGEVLDAAVRPGWAGSSRCVSPGL